MSSGRNARLFKGDRSTKVEITNELWPPGSKYCELQSTKVEITNELWPGALGQGNFYISTKVEITNELWPRFVTFEQNCA